MTSFKSSLKDHFEEQQAALLLEAFEAQMSQSKGWVEQFERDQQEMTQKMGINPADAKAMLLTYLWLPTQFDFERKVWRSEAAKWVVGDHRKVLAFIWAKFKDRVTAIKRAKLHLWAHVYNSPKIPVDAQEDQRQLLEAYGSGLLELLSTALAKGS